MLILSYILLPAVTILTVIFAASWLQARRLLLFYRDIPKADRLEELNLLQKGQLLAFGRPMSRPVNHDDPSSIGLPYETLRVRCLAGHELEIWRIPHKTPRSIIIMLHGYAVAKGVMLDQAREFYELGCEPWMVDMRGSGGSDGECTALGYHDAEDLESIVAKVRCAHGENRPPVFIYGQSLGAVAALRAVYLGRVNPAGLILEAPFDTLYYAIKNRFVLMKAPAFPFSHLMTFWAGVMLGGNGFQHNSTLYARNVRMPALLLQGEEDNRVKPHEAENLAAAFAGPCKLVWFPNASHESLVNADPELWRDNITSFLE